MESTLSYLPVTHLCGRPWPLSPSFNWNSSHLYPSFHQSQSPVVLSLRFSTAFPSMLQLPHFLLRILLFFTSLFPVFTLSQFHSLSCSHIHFLDANLIDHLFSTELSLYPCRKSIINVRVFFWTLISIAWMCMSILMIVPQCFNYCSFVSSFQMGTCDSSNFTLLFQDCFDPLLSLPFLYEF